MQERIYGTEARQAIKEQGVRPENLPRIYRLVLDGDTDDDYKALATIHRWLKKRAKRQGAPILEEDESTITRKAQAAKNN